MQGLKSVHVSIFSESPLNPKQGLILRSAPVPAVSRWGTEIQPGHILTAAQAMHI